MLKNINYNCFIEYKMPALSAGIFLACLNCESPVRNKEIPAASYKRILRENILIKDGDNPSDDIGIIVNRSDDLFFKLNTGNAYGERLNIADSAGACEICSDIAGY